MWEAFTHALELFPASVQRIVVLAVVIGVVVWRATTISDQLQNNQNATQQSLSWMRKAGERRDARLDNAEKAIVTLSENQAKMIQLQTDTTAAVNRVQDRLDNTPRDHR